MEGFGQIAQRGTATSATTTNTSLTINKPTGVVAGDVLIVNIVQNESTNQNLSNVSLAGWTIIDGRLIYDSGSNSNDNQWWGTILYRLADGTEGVSFTFALDADADMAIGSIVAFSGVDATGGVKADGTSGGPFDVDPGIINITNTNNTNTVTASSITTSTADALVIMLAQTENDRSYSNWLTTSPGALTEGYENLTTNIDDASVGAAWAVKSTAGATGNGTATLSGNSRNGGILIALKSCTPPSTPTVTASSGSICSGDDITLTITGNLNSGTEWVVYTGSCGGTQVGTTTTNFFVVNNVTSTTTYYVRGEGSSCDGTQCGSATVTVNPSGAVGVSIAANPSNIVCEGTSVTFTATPVNGGSNPTYQWKVNGINVGTNNYVYSYVPVDGDVVSCVLTSDADCVEGVATTPVSYFSWDDNTKVVTDSDIGLDAISIGGGQYVAGGVGGTTALGPITVPKTDISLNFGNNSAYNSEGVDYSISYRRAEGVSQMFTRGSSLIISGGSTFNVSYRLDDGTGSFTTVTSSNITISDDATFHDYRFKYDPSDGYGRLFIDGTEVWTSSATPGKIIYWTGAGNLIVGANTDASGNLIPTFDNLSIKGISLKSAADEVTLTVNPIPVITNPGPQTACDSYTLPTIAGTNLSGNQKYYNNSQALGGTVITGSITSSQTVWIYDANGTCSDEESFDVTVNNKPNIAAISAPAAFCDGGSYNPTTPSVTANGSTVTAQGWQLETALASGTFDDMTVPYIVSYADNGKKIRYYATNTCGTTYSNEVILTVNPLPTAFNVTGGGEYCANGIPVAIGLSGSETDVNYQLYRDGTTTVGAAVAGTGSAIGFAGQILPGTYTVVATNATTLCTNNMNSSAVVTNISVTLVNNNPVICINVGTAYLEIQSSTGNPTHFDLVFDDSRFEDAINNPITADKKIPMVIPNGGWGMDPGTYTAKLKVRRNSPSNCESQEYPVSVTISTAGGSVNTSVAVSANPVCAGTQVTFTASASDADEYRWTVNGTLQSETSSIFTYTPNNGDEIAGYAVKPCLTAVKVLNTNAIIMTVEPVPVNGTLAKTPGSASVCEGTNVSASLTPGKGGNSIDMLEYSTNGGSSWNAYTSEASISTSGLSSVQIRTRRDASYCSDPEYTIVTWSVSPSPTITLSSTDTEVCFGDILTSLVYTATTGSPDQYSIDFNATAEGQDFVDVTNSVLTGGTIDIAVPATGAPDTYSAVLTVRNSTTGCVSATQNITIIIHPLPDTSEIQAN